jgi:hypothetical protein
MDRWLLRGALIATVLLARPTLLWAQGAVQLPTFRFFTTNTTVEVPDGGGAFLGGNFTAASGRVERGIPGLGLRPFGNVATGSTRGGGTTSVRATIHDLDAMDRQLLGEDFNDRTAAADASSTDAVALRKIPVMLRRTLIVDSPARSPLATDSAGGQSIAEIRRGQAEEDAAAQQEAAQLFEQARQLQASGKPGVAKVYYRMAARQATGSLREQALDALRSLSESSQSASSR